MNLAIRKAFDGIQKGQTPFGACIVLNDETLSCSHNMVWAANDITAHAEVCAIREACRKTHSIDLNGADIYSTCEPCPMCFSACHWAKIKTIYYAATIEDASKHGFNELSISNESMKQTSALLPAGEN